MTSHCGFDLHFPDDYLLGHLFIYLLVLCMDQQVCLLWRNAYSSPYPFFNPGIYLFPWISMVFIYNGTLLRFLEE